jgi:hypothetical protein
MRTALQQYRNAFRNNDLTSLLQYFMSFEYTLSYQKSQTENPFLVAAKKPEIGKFL